MTWVLWIEHILYLLHHHHHHIAVLPCHRIGGCGR